VDAARFSCPILFTPAFFLVMIIDGFEKNKPTKTHN